MTITTLLAIILIISVTTLVIVGAQAIIDRNKVTLPNSIDWDCQNQTYGRQFDR